uniref:Uncharacterized protein n=1 Tax=Plectus sambesii TaxID=2011161 RepID=A0A914XQA3_9BILA
MSVQRVTRSTVVSGRSSDREAHLEATPSRGVNDLSRTDSRTKMLKRRRGRPPVNSSIRESTPGPSVTSKKPLKKASVGGYAHGVGRPAELFRTDFITAMKVNENDTSLDKEECWEVSDPWRQDWNKGVQIPVDPTSIPHAECRALAVPLRVQLSSTFKQPKKLMCTHKTSLYSSEQHQWVQTAKKADQICRYDVDDLDVRWLNLIGARRAKAGMEPISEEHMELVMDRLESDCYESLQQALLEPTTQRVGREFDENAACDICLSPDSEDDDEIVFCDGCDLCVHQSCYGIGSLPQGQWLCRSCSLSPGKTPQCMLCPSTGGALKCTRSGERWAHVSCVLWIPEVRFGDPETLEPVINVADIPDDRWLLRCSVCDRREGACIQCSVKNCRIAYHVTCAQRNHQYMKISQCATATGGVRLVSYCGKHSANGGVDESTQLWDDRALSHSPDLGRGETPQPSSKDAPSVFISYDTDSSAVTARPESPRKRKAKRLALIEQTFFRHVDVAKVATALELPLDVVSDVHEYWKLKRRQNSNRPLLTPKDDEESLLERYEEEALIRRVRMLVALRQNLEKARNLCYMVEKREKTKRQYTTSMQAVFTYLTRAMDDHSPSVGQMSQREVDRFVNYLLPTNLYDEAISNNTISLDVESVDVAERDLDAQMIPDLKPQSPKVADEAGRDINANVNAKLATPPDAEEATLRMRNTVPNSIDLCASEPISVLHSRKRRLRHSSPSVANSAKQRRLRNREVAYMLHNGARGAYAPVSRSSTVITTAPIVRSKR